MHVMQKGNKLVIEMTLQEPRMSGTGKNLVVATSKGPWESSVEIAGKPVILVVNAFIAADKPREQHDDDEIEDLDPTPKTKSQRRRNQ